MTRPSLLAHVDRRILLTRGSLSPSLSLSFPRSRARTHGKKTVPVLLPEREPNVNRRRVNACSFSLSRARAPSLSLSLSRAPRDLSIHDLRHHLIAFSSLAHWTLLARPTLLPAASDERRQRHSARAHRARSSKISRAKLPARARRTNNAPPFPIASTRREF